MTSGEKDDDLDLDSATVVVTGGGSGIGRALAERFSAEGARVAVVDLVASAAAEVAGSLPSATGYGLDVTDEEALGHLLHQVGADLGPVEVYCSNAGIGTGPGLGSDAAWAAAWAVHSMAHVYAARAVLPGMADRGRGHFVITASAAGLLMMMGSAPYTVTKHASVALAEWLAVTYGGAGIGIHCLAPQGVRTPMVTLDPAGEAEVAASGEILEPAEVADAVLAALGAGTFLVTPHPQVRAYEAAKVGDRDRWLASMRRLRSRMA